MMRNHPYILLYKTLIPRRYRRYLDRAAGDVDMCHEALLHGTFYEEYRLYGFKEKDDAERRSYLTDAVRNRICRRINGRKGQRIVMNKWLSYSLFHDYYKRQAWLLDNHTDLDSLTNAALERRYIVAKPVDDCGGRGVTLLNGADRNDWLSLFESLLAQRPRWILEERITQHPDMGRWNADSVNTIRMNTIQQNGKVTHFTPFILTGRNGNFVNNGAQGGLFASIDADNGIIVTDGFDENGKRYTCHPDSGTPFRGEKIPHWNELLTTTASMALQLPDVTYVGWDMAFTPQGWLCIEANKGEFVAQQVTLGKGLRHEFEGLVF